MKLKTVKCLKCGYVWNLNMTLRSIFNDLSGMIVCPNCLRVRNIHKDRILDCIPDKLERTEI